MHRLAISLMGLVHVRLLLRLLNFISALNIGVETNYNCLLISITYFKSRYQVSQMQVLNIDRSIDVPFLTMQTEDTPDVWSAFNKSKRVAKIINSKRKLEVFYKIDE